MIITISTTTTIVIIIIIIIIVVAIIIRLKTNVYLHYLTFVIISSSLHR